MPYGLQRFQQTGGSHFVTFSCEGRKPYLATPSVATLFLRCLEQVRQRYGFRVYGYVVMPEHVHLLLAEPEVELLSTALQALKISVSRRASAAGWQGEQPFWLKRYYDHNVRQYDNFVEKLRYLHRNPVRRGLCANPADWEWSSFRHYLTAEVGVVAIESQWTALRRSGRDPRLPLWADVGDIAWREVALPSPQRRCGAGFGAVDIDSDWKALRGVAETHICPKRADVGHHQTRNRARPHEKSPGLRRGFTG